MNAALEAELASWTSGEVIARKSLPEPNAVELIIARSEGRFTLLRGFMVGSRPAVSVDVDEKPVEVLLAHLLDQYQ